MVETGASHLKGFTLAFQECEGIHEDEAPVAARIASHYGIEHHIRTVTRHEFQTDLSRILRGMDQPSIDGISTWYASKAVAEHGYMLDWARSMEGAWWLRRGLFSPDDLPSLTGKTGRTKSCQAFTLIRGCP